MEWQFSLRWRLMLTYVVLIVVGFGGLALLAGQQISKGVMDDFQNYLNVEALLVASALHESVEGVHEYGVNENQVVQALIALSAQTDAHLTLLDEEGNAWLDSSGNVPPGDFSQVPEVQAAKSNDVIHELRNDEQGIPTLYTAAPVTDNNQILAIVRLSVPAAGIRNEIMRRWLTLASGVGVMSVLSLLASLWLSSSLTRPLSELRESALKLAAGDLSQRLSETRTDEIGQVASAFNHMADEVQSMLNEQRAFASNASHELRTPLTTIALRTELLLDVPLDESESRRYIIEIDQEVARLNGLVDDLILLSRIEANRLQRGQERIDPIRLAKMMQRQLETKARSKQIDITVVTPTHLPEIMANRNHLQVVFRNLLDNAIKYTPDGGKVQWELRAEHEQLHAIVSDTGQGIAPDDLPHIGKRFFRTDKARTRQIQGIGLGLSLVHLVVELYGGQLEISSPGVGKGTTVHVWWPFSQST